MLNKFMDLFQIINQANQTINQTSPFTEEITVGFQNVWYGAQQMLHGILLLTSHALHLPIGWVGTGTLTIITTLIASLIFFDIIKGYGKWIVIFILVLLFITFLGSMM